MGLCSLGTRFFLKMEERYDGHFHPSGARLNIYGKTPFLICLCPASIFVDWFYIVCTQSLLQRGAFQNTPSSAEKETSQGIIKDVKMLTPDL